MEDFREKSFWLESGDYAVNPPLEGDLKVDVAVLGGGFTGLSTAYHLKKAEPSMEVAIVEGEVVGYGASGRNAGFSMTLFGFTLGVTAFRFGKEKAKEAHHYMEQAVDLVRDLVAEHDLKSDYEHPGFLRVATSEKYETRIKKEIELAQSLGIEGIEWMEKGRLEQEIRSPLYRGAWWEPRCGLLNPAKQARELKRVVEEMGVRVFERTRGTRLERRPGGIDLFTEHGKIEANKLVVATNAWSHFVPGLKRKQVPVFTHIVLTEPLTEKHFAELGWRSRQGIEDARNLVHYYRLTKDDRLLMGGRSVSVVYGRDMDGDRNDPTFDGLEADVRQTYPALKDVTFTHRWGGPVSVPLDMTPAMGYLGDPRVAYSLGCVGHGVSLTHLNGWTLADLVLERKTERTEVFFVNRRTIPWPPEPFRFVLSKAIKGALDLEDRLYDPR